MDIPSHLLLSNYTITLTGDIFDKVHHQYIPSFYGLNNYLWIYLYDDNEEECCFTVAYLLLCTYSSLPIENSEVIYLDNNSTNLDINNLIWSNEQVIHSFDKHRIKVSYIKGEVWTCFPEHMKLSRYAASSMGRLINIQKNELIKGSTDKDTGYIKTSLNNNNNQSKAYQLHCLILEAFVKKPSKNHTCDHINRRCSDNILLNLRWATKSEQSLNRTKLANINGRAIYQLDFQGNKLQYFNSITKAVLQFKENYSSNDRVKIVNVCKGKQLSAFGFKWVYFSEADKDSFGMWKSILNRPKFEGMQISDKGFVKFADGHVTKGNNSLGYKKVKGTTVHLLIADAFKLPGSGSIINHLNGKKSVNIKENLERTSQSGNVTHAYKNGLNSSSKIVEVINLIDNSVTSYYSISEASRQLCLGKNLINAYLKNNDIVDGDKYFRYKGSEVLCSNKHYAKKYNTKAIIVKDINGNIIDEYQSIKEVSLKLNKNEDTITRYLKVGKLGLYYKDEPKKKKITLQYNMLDEFVAQYNSNAEAEKITGVISKNIIKVCNGERKSAGGFKWCYQEIS